MDKKQTGFISISLWNVKNSTSPGWQPRTGGTKSQKSLRLCLTWRIQTKKEKAYQEAFSSISKQWVGRQPSIVQRLCFLRWFQHIFEYQTKHKSWHETLRYSLLSFIHHRLLEDPGSESQPVHGDLDCRKGIGIVGFLLRLVLERTLAQDAKKRHSKEKMYTESIRYLKLCYQSHSFFLKGHFLFQVKIVTDTVDDVSR